MLSEIASDLGIDSILSDVNDAVDWVSENPVKSVLIGVAVVGLFAVSDGVLTGAAPAVAATIVESGAALEVPAATAGAVETATAVGTAAGVVETGRGGADVAAVANAAQGVAQQVPKLLDTARGNLLAGAKDPNLRNLIVQMFRKSATVGNGGTADAIRHELRTGELLSRSGHSYKGQLMREALGNLSLSRSDQQVADHLRQDLQNALSGH